MKEKYKSNSSKDISVKDVSQNLNLNNYRSVGSDTSRRNSDTGTSGIFEDQLSSHFSDLSESMSRKGYREATESSPTSMSSEAASSVDDNHEANHSRNLRPKSSKGRTRSDTMVQTTAQNNMHSPVDSNDEDVYRTITNGDNISNKPKTRPKSSKGRVRRGITSESSGMSYEESEDYGIKQFEETFESDAMFYRPKSAYRQAGVRNPRFTDGIDTKEDLNRDLDLEIESFNSLNSVDTIETFDILDGNGKKRLGLTSSNGSDAKTSPRPWHSDSYGMDTSRSYKGESREADTLLSSKRLSISGQELEQAREKVLEKYSSRQPSEGESQRRREALPQKLEPIIAHDVRKSKDLTNGHRLSNQDENSHHKQKLKPLIGRRGKALLYGDILPDSDKKSTQSPTSSSFIKRSQSERHQTNKPKVQVSNSDYYGVNGLKESEKSLVNAAHNLGKYQNRGDRSYARKPHEQSKRRSFSESSTADEDYSILSSRT